ncbi:MAG: hypothetical protein Q4D16_17070 [Eubacteriales bacterium]|nr:hypothetical protein [Eubacteriales bacterium]
MENSDSLYILFASGKYYFFVPVSWVKKITDGNVQEEEIPVVSLFGEELVPTDGQYRYRIYVEGKDTCFGIEADKAVGIRSLEEGQMIPLGAPVINEHNKYLQAVVPAMVDEQQIMGFVLNPEYLIGK